MNWAPTISELEKVMLLGKPLTFGVDDSWRADLVEMLELASKKQRT